MQNAFKEAIWKQFDAGINMHEQTLLICPPELWNGERKLWYNAYHCFFWLTQCLKTGYRQN